jgi:hypothetical protein
MTLPGTASTAAFSALCVALAVSAVLAVHRAGRRLGEPPERTRRWVLGTIFGLAAWMALTALLAASGVLADFSAMPPAVTRAIVPAALLTVVLAFSPFGTRLVRGLTLAGLVGYQAFRIAVELLLFAFHREGVIAVQMTFEGWNFDVVTGVSALVLALAARRRALPRWVVFAWNVVGLALLALIVTIAVLAMPTNFHWTGFEPPNRFVSEPPFIWLPTLLVQGALFGHLLVFRWLASRSARDSAA